MQIDANEEQDENAQSSIRCRWEFGSNTIFFRREHELKQCEPKISTDEGMKIDRSDWQ
jgi:hypothetical protein